MTAIFTITKLDLKVNDGIQDGHCGGRFLPRMKPCANCLSMQLTLWTWALNTIMKDIVLSQWSSFSHHKYLKKKVYIFRGSLQHNLEEGTEISHLHLVPTHAEPPPLLLHILWVLTNVYI